MAFTFDGAAKTITHSGGTLSVAGMWSRYVDWLAVGDNSKYGDLLTTVGRDENDIPLYVFLEPGVTIVVTDNTLPTNVVDGVLKTRSGGDPFGGAVVNARYEAPGIAIGYSTTGSTGPSAADIAAAVLALAQLTPIHSDVRKVNGDTIIGHGIPPTYDNTGTMTAPGDPWRPA